jgi:hypothetical protein
MTGSASNVRFMLNIFSNVLNVMHRITDTVTVLIFYKDIC